VAVRNREEDEDRYWVTELIKVMVLLKNLFQPEVSFDKSHYENIPFDVPDGWNWSVLGNICYDFQYGTSQKSVKKGRVAVLRMGNLQDGEINYTDLAFTSDISDIKKYTLQPNDLLFNRTNSPEWVGKTAIYRGNLPAIFAGYLIRVKPIIVNPRYMNYLMSSDYHRKICLQVKTDGVNQSNINAQKLSNFFYPIAPISEQERIVTAIESAFYIIDEIENNKRDLLSAVISVKYKILSLAIHGKLVPQDPNDEPASVLLERIKKERKKLIKQGKIKPSKGENAIIRSDDNCYYTELPDSWEMCKLEYCWELISGRDLEATEYFDKPNGIPYITGASNFYNNKLIINRWTPSPKVIAENGDLLITCKGTVGEMLMCELPECHIARQIMAVRNVFDLNSDFLRYSLLFLILRIISSARGIIPGISREDLLDINLFLPPVAEQNRIVAAIEKSYAQLDNIAATLA
jgi:type I restriction enzyme S subunit